MIASSRMRISATWCWTSGWYAIERVSATEVRRDTLAVTSSNARWAMPV